MPCVECVHCQELASLANLTLSPAAPASLPGTIDRGFYRSFAVVYSLARRRSAQPMKLLRKINPDLTAARCGAYLKRAKALGYLDEPRPVPGPVAAPAPSVPEPRKSGGGRRGSGGRKVAEEEFTDAEIAALSDADLDLLTERGYLIQ